MAEIEDLTQQIGSFKACVRQKFFISAEKLCSILAGLYWLVDFWKQDKD